MAPESLDEQIRKYLTDIHSIERPGAGPDARRPQG